MISQLQLKGGQSLEGTRERGSSISSMDRANPKLEGWGAGRAEKPSSSHAPDPLPSALCTMLVFLSQAELSAAQFSFATSQY